MPGRRIPPPVEGLLVAALLALFAGLAWSAQRRMSATFDEPMHLLAGHLLTTGEHGVNFEHPPLVKRLFGWACRATGARLDRQAARWRGQTREGWPAAQAYLYRNDAGHRRLLSAGRAVGLALSLVLLGASWAHARAAFGAAGGLAALAVLACSPTLLGHGALANLDVALAAWLVLASACLWRAAASGALRWTAAAGVALGAALATKHTALLALPAIGLWLLLEPRRPAGWRPPLLLLLAAAATLALACGSVEGLRWYGRGLASLFEAQPRQAAYLLGRVVPGGVWYYFGVALGVKLALPLLLLGLTGLVLGLSAAETRGPLLLPALLAAVFCAAHAVAGADLGVRYVLIVWPALALGLASLFAQQAKSRTRILVLLAGLAWQAGGALVAWPDYLAYFNEPSRRAGHAGRLLADSNLDWGQDLPALARLIERRRAGRVYLAYFGTASPAAHGVRAIRLPGFGQYDAETAPPAAQEGGPVLLAVSRNLLCGLYAAPPTLYDWTRHLPRAGTAGRSIVVFDATRARGFIAAVCWEAGDWRGLLREVREASPGLRLELLQAIHQTSRYQQADGPYLLGSALRLGGDLAGAEFELQASIAAGRRVLDARYELALVQRQTGRRREALESARHALDRRDLSEEQRRRWRELRRSLEPGH